MSINYGVQPAKFEGNDTDLFAFLQRCISNAYLFKVSISHILDCYNSHRTFFRKMRGKNDEL